MQNHRFGQQSEKRHVMAITIAIANATATLSSCKVNSSKLGRKDIAVQFCNSDKQRRGQEMFDKNLERKFLETKRLLAFSTSAVNPLLRRNPFYGCWAGTTRAAQYCVNCTFANTNTNTNINTMHINIPYLDHVCKE